MAYTRPLVIILFAGDVIVTVIFKANVEAQAGAYATGVLVLILSAALAVALALWHEAARDGPGRARKRLLGCFFGCSSPYSDSRLRTTSSRDPTA